ncbi:hypothetical protein ACH4TM_22790 [Streptomyces parvus]|uniref:hypothetical protein n=1 Tax=Streptomyces TaxID=1883 RepID=UPI00379079B8
MLIEHYIVDVRRQFTGESLTGARRRLHGLRDWSKPLPAAHSGDQARLEGHLLQALGTGRGRNPLGVTEVVPGTDHLVLRLESVDTFAPLLRLMPYRDRRRSRHGLLDLRVSASRRGIELVLGRSGSGRALIVGPQGCDLTTAVDDHRQAIESMQYLQLWTRDTPHDPMPRPMTSRRPRPKARPMDPYAVRAELASALLRRLHLWNSLVAGSSVTFTSQPLDSGLLWTVERCVPHHRPLHDDIATALADPVAGPGLPLDATDHPCDQEQCVQSFDSGRLTVRTIRGENDRPARPASRARAHVRSTFLREAKQSPIADDQTRAGHVLQLIAPWGEGHAGAADQLAAAWAREGLHTLILSTGSSRETRNTAVSWRRARLTGGRGAMFKAYSNLIHHGLEADIARARGVFDHIILVKRNWTDTPLLGFSPLADDHLIVAGGQFPKTTRTTTVRAGELRRRSLPLTPAESAVAWLHHRLGRVPFSDVPMTGLLLWCERDESCTDGFDTEVDAELARHGMPVLGRLPQTPRFSPDRTVLDYVPDEQRKFVIQQANQVRQCLGPAHANATAFRTALREYADL